MSLDLSSILSKLLQQLLKVEKLIILIYLIRTIRNILYHTFVWQLKEYRFDRMYAHLRTTQGFRWMLGIFTLLKWVILIYLFFVFLILLYFISFYSAAYEKFLYPMIFFAFFLPITIYFVEGIKNIYEFIRNGWRIPVFTPKVIVVASLTFFITTLIVLASIRLDPERDALYVGLLVGDKLLGPIIAFLILISNIPSFFYKKWIIARAKNKINRFRNLIVIGITGSYGKTSTKEFLATILGEKFKVLKTSGFNNTDIGIATSILKELKPEHEVFVVEMGAYKKGEIKTICEMVKPKIGIITGINQQHLELFGSIGNTQKAKFELIESLPKDGIAIFNGSNKYCLEMAKWADNMGLTTIIYDKNKEITNIKVSMDHLEFKFDYQKKAYKMTANLLGEHNAENILAAIHGGLVSGMTMKQIQKGVANISSPTHTMKLTKANPNIYLVDDTFNANPDGVIAALKYMQTFKGEKILVLTPLIELGEESKKAHRMLGKESAKICDLVLLTNSNYNDSFIQGAEELGKGNRVKLISNKLKQELLQRNFKHDSIILFEGKEAGRILERLVISH